MPLARSRPNPDILRMNRRRLLILLALAAGPAAAETPAAERQRQLDAWWARQREKEAAERARNAPREAHRDRTRDQFERWNRQNDRRRGIAPYPF